MSIERARTWVKTLCPMSPVTIRLDAQFGNPYPRSAGFDTDIGAFIESSAASSSRGSMDPSIIYNNAVQGDVFLPGQLFVFGGLGQSGAASARGCGD